MGANECHLMRVLQGTIPSTCHCVGHVRRNNLFYRDLYSLEKFLLSVSAMNVAINHLADVVSNESTEGFILVFRSEAQIQIYTGK